MIQVVPKRERREEILDAAATLFKERGYAATTMRDLAEKIGIEAASLYNHIHGKQDLLRQICFNTGQAHLTEMTRVEAMQADPATQVRAMIAAHVRLITQDVAAAAVANEEWRHLKEPYYAEFQQVRRDYEFRFGRLIQRAMASGAFRDIHPQIALYTILSSLSWLQHWYRAGRSVTAEEIEDSILQLLIEGLQK